MTTSKFGPGIALLVLLSLTTTAQAEGRTVREFASRDFMSTFPFVGPSNDYGEKTIDGLRTYRDDANRAFVEVVTPANDGGRTVNVLTLDAPPVTQCRYFLLGSVEYENVDGRAYLEMWNDFPDGGHYFSRTMGDSGAMMAISGTSAKRAFMLPFTSELGKVPSRLALNVVLPGRGKVILSRMRLVENGEPATTQAARNDVNTLDGEMLALKDPLKKPRLAAQALRPNAPLAPAVIAMMTPTDVKHAGNGVSAFTFEAADPSGTRQMIVRHYPRPVGGFPATLRGRFTWRGVTGEAASIGHFSDIRAGHDRVQSGRVRTQGTDGSIDFDLPITDADAEWVAVNVACPGPGRYEVDLPESLSAAMASLAWLDRHFAALFGGLVAVMLLAMVPLRLMMKSGRGRAAVLGFFGLMFAGGVGQLFAAGVALGMGRPADAWVTLLGCAAILLVSGGLMLRQARAHYSGFELRKLRAMDVA